VLTWTRIAPALLPGQLGRKRQHKEVQRVGDDHVVEEEEQRISDVGADTYTLADPDHFPAE